MTNLVSFEGEREKRKVPCVYCGGEPHTVVLACPRIYSIVVSDEGYVCEIIFRRSWTEPELAGPDPV
jgi:hypothetical protein